MGELCELGDVALSLACVRLMAWLLNGYILHSAPQWSQH